MKTPTNLLILAATLFFAAPSFGQAIEDLLTEAQRAYVQGNSAAAKEKFELVRRLSPDNRTAIAYLRRIIAEEAQTNASKGPPNATLEALDKLILPRVELREASLAEVLDFLRQKGNQIGEGKVAINFVPQLDDAAKAAKITLSLQNVPFTEVLRYIGTLANVEFDYQRFAIVVKPKGPGRPADAATGPAPTAGAVKVDGLN